MLYRLSVSPLSLRATTVRSERSGAALRALAADATRKLDVLGHDGDTLGVDGVQVGVLKEANEVSPGRLDWPWHAFLPLAAWTGPVDLAPWTGPGTLDWPWY